jgi:3-hydroxyacyl-[acyl-carrier-protein] dehydratase
MPEPSGRIEIEGLLRLLPHRYPFLLIDRVVDIEAGVRVTGLKNVTVNEPFFAGREGMALMMPGLLIIEAMAQTGAVLLMLSQESPHQKLVYFAGVDDARWEGTVRPGDQLRIEIAVTRARGRLSRVHGIARVEDTIVCEADLAAVLVDRPAGKSDEPA